MSFPCVTRMISKVISVGGQVWLLRVESKFPSTGSIVVKFETVDGLHEILGSCRKLPYAGRGQSSVIWIGNTLLQSPAQFQRVLLKQQPSVHSPPDIFAILPADL